ncbi:helix-turn-helix domain-containing protein [Tsukamurella sp. 8F]|uniref:AraC-like ligand-binding domain-containing protein n=1 Tax=unclassified Tsukamurella TaxID=2633480 RepID=UPI0023B90F01|nr:MULTISPECIES: helix-turn-helix domain-containing protein [unclassified Tsukamurella]MDF0528993.1 helix-turn-helix domain-containing protein [Tsukamurella sp. 8J]MDF0587366.1 helix-turn-helix domain-containing protein [Tsukamurella sp. 8F]
MTTACTRFDAAELDHADRFDAWYETVRSSFVPLRADASEPAAFTGRLVAQTMGGLAISTVAATGVTVRRTRREIASGDPGFVKVGLQLLGRGAVTQDGRTTMLDAGDFAVYDTSRPYRLDYEDAFAVFVVMAPSERLRIPRPRLSELTAQRFDGRYGLPAMVSRLLGELSRQLDDLPVRSDPVVADAVLDLLTATLADRMDVDPAADAHRRALLLEIQTGIISRLAEPDLTVPDIASAHHVSVRYLQKLFGEHGETVSGWVRARRLERIRRDLANPAMADRTVASIGARWGIENAAALSRLFRAEVGCTPTEFRATAARWSASV